MTGLGLYRADLARSLGPAVRAPYLPRHAVVTRGVERPVMRGALRRL
jgi:hypothetical protein